jgi:uncharacterized membrane protein
LIKLLDDVLPNAQILYMTIRYDLSAAGISLILIMQLCVAALITMLLESRVWNLALYRHEYLRKHHLEGIFSDHLQHGQG